jgi:predicted O-linked N-acetylglucosamine transferase (SPINDLY family)
MIREDYGQWLARGRAHQQKNRPIDAMVCYRRALKSNAYSAQVQYRLGEVLSNLGRHQEALDAWRKGLALSPSHEGLLLNLASTARSAGAHAEAIEAYQRVLAAQPDNAYARLGQALTKLAMGDPAAGGELGALLRDGKPFERWDEVVSAVAVAPPSPARASFLFDLAATHAGALPVPLLAAAAAEMISAGERDRARELLARAEPLANDLDEPETLRLLAFAASVAGAPGAWAERYAQSCVRRFGSGAPTLWPRRTAGAALRVAYLVLPGARIEIGAAAIELTSYLGAVVAAHSRERIDATVYFVADQVPPEASMLAAAGVRAAAVGAAPAPALARSLAESDADVLIDLVGMRSPLGPLLAQKIARSQRSYTGLAAAHAAPLIDATLAPPEGADEEALARHRLALERALLESCAAEPWWQDVSARSAAETTEAWRAAVGAHQRGEVDAAIKGYRELLADQPKLAPAQYLLGVLLRDRGQVKEAEQALAAAVADAPGYVDARIALAEIHRERGHTARAVTLAKQGLALKQDDPSLWRALGLARLAQGRTVAARKAFKNLLALAPIDAEAHYNYGVAMQSVGARTAALHSYQRALALNPDLVAADYNIGVIFREQGKTEAAIRAFEQVIAQDPRHVSAHKALCETLLEARQLDDWYQAFDRFEAACPDALPMAVMALQVSQYRADFAAVDRYLAGLQGDEFRSANDAELADRLEELLFVILYFDVDPEALFALYKTYDAVARRVYGRPQALPPQRKPGPIRVGYLSGDLRNHVMGKMMLPAIERHDRKRFELFFYSLSTKKDEWTERYRQLSPHFVEMAALSERDAAARIAEDDLDLLVDLATNTFGSKPGILARKPARVLITHLASAGVVGLSTVDFKLTDAYADVPESQSTMLERLLPMEGCAYPYRHIEPAQTHPYRREEFDIAPDAVVIGAFVNPLKLSRRCLNLWREILERIPNAVLAVSPLSPERRSVFGRLLSAAGIPHSRARILPQGRNDAENQARYSIVDFALDPMPYGGVNSTIEALDMGVPVVTLVGRRHGERSSYSILSDLGVKQTVAATGREYIEIAMRLATDKAFMTEVRGAIRAGIQRSPLTDMDGHARALERAYLRALEQRYPAALTAARDG